MWFCWSRRKNCFATFCSNTMSSVSAKNKWEKNLDWIIESIERRKAENEIDKHTWYTAYIVGVVNGRNEVSSTRRLHTFYVCDTIKKKIINSSLFYVSLAIHAHWTVCVCVSGAWLLRDNSSEMTHCQNGLADKNIMVDIFKRIFRHFSPFCFLNPLNLWRFQ